MLYLWLKVFHQFSIMAWYAGLWYLPRLFVYHAECNEHPVHEKLTIMMYRLYTYIMTPALFIVLISGLSIVYINSHAYLNAGWFHVKLTAVFFLIIFHFVCRWHLSQFQSKKNIYSGVYFRAFNEVPTVLLIVILSMAVVKPF